MVISGRHVLGSNGYAVFDGRSCESPVSIDAQGDECGEF